jgi:prolyl 4-hydroxylase
MEAGRPESIARAEALAAQGRTGEALDLLASLGEAGDPEALFRLAAWRLGRRDVPRDFAAARALFARAAEAGHARAAVIHTNFVANGTGGAPDWPQALARLRALAAEQPGCRRQLALIEAMALTDTGDPQATPEAKTLSASPQIGLFPKLFSDDECDYLSDAAAPLLKPSTVVEPGTGRNIQNPIRTAHAAGFPPIFEDPAIHALNRRLASASGTGVDQGESLQVLRYTPGQEYKTHIDAVPSFDNPRILTVLVYLNEDYEGGETFFPSLDLKVRGKKGDALMFRNVLEDGRPDERTAHAGLPVTRGAKLIASRWIRQRRFEPPLPPGQGGGSADHDRRRLKQPET